MTGEPQIYCRSCGCALPASANFCLTCGTPVDSKGFPSSTVGSPPIRFSWTYLFGKASELLFSSKSAIFLIGFLIINVVISGVAGIFVDSFAPASIEDFMGTFTMYLIILVFAGFGSNFFQYLMISTAVGELRGESEGITGNISRVIRRLPSLILYFLLFIGPSVVIVWYVLFGVIVNPSLVTFYLGVLVFGELLFGLVNLILLLGFFIYVPLVLFDEVGFREGLGRCGRLLDGYWGSVIAAVLVTNILLNIFGNVIEPLDFIITNIATLLISLYMAITYHWVSTHRIEESKSNDSTSPTTLKTE